MAAFLGIFWWVFIHKKKEDYHDAEQLPFADEKDENKADTNDEGETK
jgi:cbb3-type cytochrome oxidase subunit 3